jgi:hypothetical protein
MTPFARLWAIGPADQLLAAAGIPDDRSSAVLANDLTVVGSDEVWFTPGDGRYYLAQTAAQNLRGH